MLRLLDKISIELRSQNAAYDEAPAVVLSSSFFCIPAHEHIRQSREWNIHPGGLEGRPYERILKCIFWRGRGRAQSSPICLFTSAIPNGICRINTLLLMKCILTKLCLSKWFKFFSQWSLFVMCHYSHRTSRHACLRVCYQYTSVNDILL